VDAVAVDYRWAVKANRDMVDGDLRGETTYRSGDLGDRDELANLEYFGSGQQ